MWRYRSTVVWAVAVPTVYLWICDRIAIGLGVWQISERYTTGLGVGGLPIEEAVFFLITNVMVVQGLVLFRLPLWRHRMAPAQAVASSRSGATSSAP